MFVWIIVISYWHHINPVLNNPPHAYVSYYTRHTNSDVAPTTTLTCTNWLNTVVYYSVTEAVQSQRDVTSRLDQLSRMASCLRFQLRFQPLIVDIIHIVQSYRLLHVCYEGSSKQSGRRQASISLRNLGSDIIILAETSIIICWPLSQQIYTSRWDHKFIVRLTTEIIHYVK